MAPPTQEAVDNFKSFSGVFQDDIAIKFLQGAGNNVETAINHYYDNPERYTQQAQGYDETAFSRDRYGVSEPGESIRSFQIHPHDEQPFQSFQPSYEEVMAPYQKSGAPTRPNSRQSSMKAQISPQESGVIGSSGAVFGPANRDHYEPSLWAMTVADSAAVEIIPDVDVQDRTRLENEPAIMKPLGNGDPLPAFITILGQIPLVQKLFVEYGHVLDDYGKDSAWWSGTSIELPETTDMGTNDGTNDDLALLHETQRLMAFMLSTERLYGSLEPLTKLKALENAESLEEVTSNRTKLHNYIDRFVVAWTHAIKPHEGESHASDLFRTIAQDGETDMSVFTMEVALDQITETEPKDLYDAVDDMIWAHDGDGSQEQEIYLTQLPPILVLRVVKNNYRNIDIDIPAVWYLDRYTEEHREAAKQMRRTMADCRSHLLEVANQARRLELYQTAPNRPTSSSRGLLESTIEYLRRDPSNVQRDAITPMEETEDDDVEDDDEEGFSLHTDDSRARQLADDLEKIHENLRKKLEEFDTTRSATAAKLQQLSKLLKQPSEDENEDQSLQPKHRYHLRGVCTNYKNVYVYKSSNFDGAEEDWWKFEYTINPSIGRFAISQSQVLEAAKSESPEVILIYASDAACASESIAIPEPLQRFMADDNELLRVEQAEANRWPTDGYLQSNSSWDGQQDYEAEEELPPPYDDEEMLLQSDAVELEVTDGVSVGDEDEEWVATQEGQSAAEKEHAG